MQQGGGAGGEGRRGKREVGKKTELKAGGQEVEDGEGGGVQ